MKMSRISGGLLLAAAVAVSGCASVADLRRTQRDLRETRTQLADSRIAIEGLRQQIDTLKSPTGMKPSADVERRISGLESRLRILESQGMTYPPANVPPPVTGTAPSPVPGAPLGTEGAPIAMRRDGSSATAPEAYRMGIELYKQGQWEKAVAKFREVVRAGGKSDTAASAQYWIGESYYNQRDFSRAIMELNEVLVKYPMAPCVPTTLLALATSFADSGDKVDAKLILQKLISDHGSTDEAKIGRVKLDALLE